MSVRTKVAVALLVAAGIAAPFFVYPVFLMKALCFAIFACAFNLLFGFAGLLSFGHGAFLGGGAYITGYVVKIWGLTPELGLLTGMAVMGVLGFAFAVLATRRQGIYFAMITFGLAQMVYFAALQMPFTGGEDGLQTIPRRALFGIIGPERAISVGRRRKSYTGGVRSAFFLARVVASNAERTPTAAMKTGVQRNKFVLAGI